jgi:HK97 family phage major capsid protein
METKSRSHQGGGSEIKSAMRDFLSAFENFKEANDARLAAIEKKRDDVVLTEKVDRISRALTEQKAAVDRLTLAGKRPAQGETHRAEERKAAIGRYMRQGDPAALIALATKSLNATNDAEGGYLAPEPTERIINAAVRDISPIRQIATVREIGATVFKKPVSLGGGVAGWVGETGGRVETQTPTLASIDFPTMELYAMPAASQTLLDDAVVDIEQWLADEVQGEFAAQETSAFVSGDGVNKPKGFLSYPITEDSIRGQNDIGYVASGAAGGFAASNPADRILDLIYAPKQAYRANARFVLNRKTLSVVRKFKDSDGNYLWQPSLVAGAPSTLFGYPVTEVEEMPSIAANSFSIAFGDFARGYLIVDRQGVKILRDPYSAKPYVLFYTTKRVGGGVQNFDAIKVMKFAAS